MPYFNAKTSREPGSYTVHTRVFDTAGRTVSSYPNTYQATKQMIVETRTGTSTPGYHNPNRTGLLPVNSYTYVKTTEKYMTGSYRSIEPASYWGNGYESNGAGCFGESISNNGYLFGAGIPDGVIRAARASLTNTLLQRVKDQKVNLAVAYAERAQTKRMVGDALQRLALATGAVRKGNLAKAAKHLGVSPKAPRGQSGQNAIAANWLALQYGWKPLVSDIYGLVEFLHKKNMDRPIYERVRVTKALSNGVTSGERKTQTMDYFGTCEQKLDITMGCTFVHDSTPTRDLASLGITNPLLVAWELLPWSFVVDWFFPLGNYLELLDATNGVAFVQGFTTDFKKTTYRTQGTNKSYGSYTSFTGQRTGSYEVIEVSRSKLSGFPSPQFPNFKDPYSHTHFANAYALFRTNFRK